jgi:hypothetical protein
MFVVERNSKREEFDTRFAAGFGFAMKVYNKTLDNSFAEDRTWDEAFAETVQRNGRVLPAGFSRPTFDMGNLMKVRVSNFVTPTEMDVTYPIDYSDDIFEGFTSLAENYVPARPLPQIVPNEIDWPDAFLDGWNGAT